MFCEAIRDLKEIKATIKYISIKPCLERVISNDGWIYEGAKNVPIDDAFMLRLVHINWLIIGAQTNPYKPPEIAWVREIVEAANKAGVRVFLKNNLRPLLIPEDCSKPNYLTEDIFWASEKAQLRQEMPE